MRKQLHGVSAETRLGQEAYSPAVSERVYAALFAKAWEILSDGHTVIVDAIFDRAADRQKIEACGRTVGVPFTALWLEGSHGSSG
jgi:predicted kinase